MVLRVPHQAGTHRIQMNISNQLQQIAIPIHQEGLVSSLKQMTHPFVATVDPARVPEAYVLHPSGQRNMTRLDGQMDVIAHTTEPMHPITKPPDAFLQQAIQVSIIVVFKEDVLSTVAPRSITW